MSKRYKIEQDESGHSYCIPVDQEEEFDRLLENLASNPDLHNEFVDKFGHCRCNAHCLTFENPKY